MSSGRQATGAWMVAALVVAASCGRTALADHSQFTSSFLSDANSWPGSAVDAGIFGQGFSPSVDSTPDPGHTAGELVGLDRFTFFKDGNTDSASNIKLAVFDNFYLDLTGLTTSRPEFMGLSTNTIASTAGLGVGDPYTFEFDNLQLEYGGDYGALFVNDDGLGNLTPVKVSALTADYSETSPGSGVFEPTSNYGGVFDFQYATSNFINSTLFGDFLFGFSDGGDAKFEAVFDLDDSRDTDFEFSNSFLNDANTWPGSAQDPGIFGQGFRPSLDPSQAGLLATDQVGLDSFSFFKDGNLDGQTDIKLVIVDDMFLDLDALTTASPEVVGVSTNTIASTAGLALGDKYTFNFDSIQLDYIDDYAAIFVNDDGLGNLTPIKVSALTVDYVETSPGSGVFVPASNYGDSNDFQYAASNSLDMPGSGSFLISFPDGGDARFEAVYNSAGIDGDFDGDGDVDLADLMKWQRDDGAPAGLALWQGGFGAGSSPVSVVSVVPEPGSATMACLLVWGLIAASGRKKD